MRMSTKFVLRIRTLGHLGAVQETNIPSVHVEQVSQQNYSNDVYNVDVSKTEPVGGAARFVTAIRQTINAHNGPTLVLFSGDAFSPSPLTSLTKGDEIPPILNATNIDVACIGNHELDNGVQIMQQRISETNFPWLISNVFENNSTVPLTPIGGIHLTHTITRAGFKFGFLALAAYEWLATLDKITVDDIIYHDFREAAQKLAHQLRHDQKCDFIIALTHMKLPDDCRLARQVNNVDLILGGHDHILCKNYVNDRWIVKSGTDFKNFSTIDIQITENRKLEVEEPVHYSVTSEYTEDPEIAKLVAAKLQLLGNVRHTPIATSTTDLDGRFVSIRSRETGLGNFVCDAMIHHIGANIGFLNAGSFRSDTIEPVGSITKQTIDSILPFNDRVVMVACTGRQIINILENGVSQYPLLDGRFCQVSGLSFSFDAKKAPGQRINRGSVMCMNGYGTMDKLEDDMEYPCAMKTYIFTGKDGFPQGDDSKIIRKSELHMREIVRRYLQHSTKSSSEVPVISPRVEGRIVCLHPDEELMKLYKD